MVTETASEILARYARIRDSVYGARKTVNVRPAQKLVEKRKEVRRRLHEEQARETAKRAVSLRYVLRKFAHYTGFSEDDLRDWKRPRDLVLVRQAVMYWMCRRTDASTTMIGKFMGDRDHTTVLHSRKLYPKKRKSMGRHLKELR